MEATDRTQYSASASLLGYIYQCRLSLLETLKCSRRIHTDFEGRWKASLCQRDR